jgi:hypothetical protein
MSGTRRICHCAILFIAAFVVSTASRAQSPFDGTWRVDLAHTTFSPKPLSFYIAGGWYHCEESCNPPIVIAADAIDHPVSGHSYSSMSVTIIDPHTIYVIARKGGKVIFEQTLTVSADRKTLTVKSTEYPVNGYRTTTYETTLRLSGIPPLGAHATSGRWIIAKQSASGNDLLITYKTTGDAFTMSYPAGQTYTARFDGRDYPVTGAYGRDAVSLKKINARTIEETSKRNGTVTDVSTMTASANGKSMTVVDNDKLANRTSTITLIKLD